METSDEQAGPGPHEGAVAPRRLGRRWPIVLIIAGATALCAALIRLSYFHNDDFLNAGVARHYGPSWSLFTYNGFGHLAPVDRFLHLFLINVSSLNYDLGVLIIVLLFAGVLLALWWVLAELETPTFVTGAVILVAGTSVILLHVTLWFDQSTFLLPASAFILLVTASYLRWERTGQTRWMVVSWVLFAASLLTQERPMVVLAYLVVLRYVVIRPRGTYFARRVLGDWRLWTPYLVIAALYLWVYVAGGYFQKKPKPTTSQMVEYLHQVSLELLRELVGLPALGVPNWVTTVVIVIAVVLIVAIVRAALHDSRVWKAVVFAVVCILVNLFPVMTGRVGVYSPFQVASDIQYLLDPMLVVGIAVGIGTSGWLEAPRSHRHSMSGQPERRVTLTGLGVVGTLVCVVIVAVHLAVVPTGANHEMRIESSAGTVRHFVDNLRSGLTGIDNEPEKATILPLIAPTQVVPSFISPYNFEGLVFPILPEWHNYQTGPVKVVGSNGTLVATTSNDTATVSGGEVRGSSVWTNLVPVASPAGETCATGTGQTGGVTIHLPTSVSGEALAADIHYSTSTSFTGTLGTATATTSAYNALATTFGAGQSQRVVTWVEGKTADRLLIAAISPESRFCILSVQVGSLVTTADSSGVCHTIDEYGAVGRPTFCGVAWQ